MKINKILGKSKPTLIATVIMAGTLSAACMSSWAQSAPNTAPAAPVIASTATSPAANPNANSNSNVNNNGSRLLIAPVDTAISEKINVRVFYKNSTFENIFYKNLEQELEVEKNRTQNIGKSSLEANVIKYATELTAGQLNEAIEIGLADIALIPTSNFYNNGNDSIDFLDYPFMFTDLTQVQNRFFTTSRLMFGELNKRSNNAIPIAVMPYSFRIIASQKKNLTANELITEPLTIEDNLVVKKSYSLFKSPTTLKTFSKTAPGTQTLDVAVLDFFDNKYYQNYKNVYLSNHSLKSYVVVIGKNWWISLTGAQRDFVVQALSRSVQKSTEEIINFNSVILNTLEAQSEISVKKVDYFNDWAQLRASFNQTHYRAAGNPEIIKYYKSIQGN